MSGEKDKDLITFEEFCGVCTEAGLGVDDEAQMYADFKYGRAMADLADVLVEETEAEKDIPGEVLLGMMEARLNDIYGDGTSEEKYKAAVDLSSAAIRYACEYLTEVGGN